MSPISRRTSLQVLAASAAATLAPLTASSSAPAALAPSSSEAAALAALARQFIAQHRVPGLSVAFAHRGQPAFQAAFQAAFGLADEAARVPLTTQHRFRIASLSKPLTAVAIFLLIQQKKLQLDAKVFAPAYGLAPDLEPTSCPHLAAISVHHLLTHTSGTWPNDNRDPMFRFPALGHAELIARTLRDQPPQQAPGQRFAYSNFGYCLLGRLIEKISGQSYPDFVQAAILAPCGISGMQIAGNTLAERAPSEVVYSGRDGEDPYNINVRRMDSHGGWLATPSDLLSFLTHCDGAAFPSDLLNQISFQTMMAPTNANPGYASGWAVNAAPNRWHTGSLPGTTAIAVQTARGLCWVACANSRSKDLASALDRLMWDLARAVPAWKA